MRQSGGDGSTSLCLVTGHQAPIARLHPSIKGVDGAQSSGASLVSFNLDAFSSYGKAQGDNAPTSEAAAFRYSTALNRLLDRGISHNRLRIGDATVAFWADTSDAVDEAAARMAEELFIEASGAADQSGPEDRQEAAKLRDALAHVAKGHPIAELGLGLVPGTRFHVLGLAPNAARLSVRFWLEDSLDVFITRLARHHADLAIEPSPWSAAKPPSIQWLLVRSTALMEKFDNIPPLLAGEVTRAVLSGGRYPRTLLAAVITRLRAGDDSRRGFHASVIKAVLNRSEQEKLPVALDPENPNVAYQLGRLFAVLESAQYAALGKVNASIADRYYASASATPARVFAPLLRGLRNHTADVHRRGQGGWIDAKVGQIMLKLPPDLPRTLRLEDQGRFAVGYYHERATRSPKAEATPDTAHSDHTHTNESVQ
jgi:CRISPR-associated protein Csd1